MTDEPNLQMPLIGLNGQAQVAASLALIGMSSDLQSALGSLQLNNYASGANIHYSDSWSEY